MTKVKVNMLDQFSKSTHTKTLEVTDAYLAKLEHIQINNIVLNRFDKKAQINYNWIIEEIELLN